MSKKTLRNLIFSLTLFAVVVAIVLIAFFNVLRSSQTLETQVAAVAAQTQQEEELLRLQRIAKDTEAERVELASYLMVEDEYISVLSEIESIAPTLGLQLETTGIEELTQDNKEWIQTNFSVNGEKEAVQTFIGVLENLPYVSRVTSVRMSGARSTTWEADIVFQVQLLSYDQ